MLAVSLYIGVYSTLTQINKLFQPATCNLQDIPADIFGIFNVIVLAALGGFLTRKLSRDTFPPLLGMLVVGFILRNVPGINVARYIDKKWSATLRSMALVVILTRSGLELDPGALQRLKFTVVRLAFSPCIGEAITVAVVGKLLLDMPWLWGFQLG